MLDRSHLYAAVRLAKAGGGNVLSRTLRCQSSSRSSLSLKTSYSGSEALLRRPEASPVDLVLGDVLECAGIYSWRSY